MYIYIYVYIKTELEQRTVGLAVLGVTRGTGEVTSSAREIYTHIYMSIHANLI